MGVLKKLVVIASEKPTKNYTWLVNIAICFFVWVANVITDLVLSPKRLAWFLFVNAHEPKTQNDSLLRGAALVALFGFFGFGLFGYARELKYHDSILLLEWCVAAWCLPILIVSMVRRAFEVLEWFYDGAEDEDLSEHFLT